MKKVFYLAAMFLSLAFVSTIEADITVFNDFEGGTTTNGGGSFNGQQQFISGATPDFTGDTSFSSGTFTSVSGLGGSSLAGNFTVGTGSNYDGFFDIPTIQLANAGFVFNDPSLTTTVTFDYVLDGSTTTTVYNQLVGIANTDNTDGDNFSQGVSAFDANGAAATGVASIDVTDLLAVLDPAVNPDYTNLRILANKDNDSIINITIDNIAVSQIAAIPEPSSMAVLGLAGLVFLRRRK